MTLEFYLGGAASPDVLVIGLLIVCLLTWLKS